MAGFVRSCQEDSVWLEGENFSSVRRVHGQICPSTKAWEKLVETNGIVGAGRRSKEPNDIDGFVLEQDANDFRTGVARCSNDNGSATIRRG